MWRHLLYLACVVGTALLAAVLIALVVEPRLAGAALTGRLRQLSAGVGLVLIGSCGYGMFCWLRYATMTEDLLNR
jgi:hypothetical protein